MRLLPSSTLPLYPIWLWGKTLPETWVSVSSLSHHLTEPRQGSCQWWRWVNTGQASRYPSIPVSQVSRPCFHIQVKLGPGPDGASSACLGMVWKSNTHSLHSRCSPKELSNYQLKREKKRQKCVLHKYNLKAKNLSIENHLFDWKWWPMWPRAPSQVKPLTAI